MTARPAFRAAALCLGVAALALAAGCAKPPDAYHPLNVRAPRDAKGEFHVEERPGGFTIFVEYARHQDWPDNAVVMRACRTALVGIAREVADIRGRAIKPIDETAAAIAVRRNEAMRLTSCDGRLAVDYVD